MLFLFNVLLQKNLFVFNSGIYALNLDVMVELVKYTDTYRSFHISCNFVLPKVFLAATLWPEGSYVLTWNQTIFH